MTNRDAIDYLKNTAKHRARFGEISEPYEIAVGAMEEIEKYRNIGTVDEFKEMKEKQIAKKPIFKFTDGCGNKVYSCPECKNYVMSAVTVMRLKHCIECGQLIDWSDNDN